jgi:hypothetical protein
MEAYKQSYNASNMKYSTINKCVVELMNNPLITTYIDSIQKKKEEEFSHTITDSLRLDFELIERYKKHIAVLENPQSTDKEIAIAKRTIQFIGIKGFDSAMDRVSKKLGFYEKNNEQRQPTININSEYSDSDEKRLQELKQKLLNLDAK